MRSDVTVNLFLAAAVSILLVSFTPLCWAITGSRSAASDAVARSVVTIIGSRGTVCTGTLIAPAIVLTAGHCIASGTTYRVIDSTTQPPRLVTAQKAVTHPQFNMQTMLAHRATADVALLQLPSPVPKKSPAILGAPRIPIQPGSRFTVAGVGVTTSGGDDGVGTIRAANLVVTGNPGTLQMRLVDPVTQNKSSGMGACTGDSGAPAFEDQDGKSVIAGVVSWSTGPNNGDGCGGLTGITPLTLYKDWIVKTAREWGAAF
ncbi:MAG: S1 family peptidase [Afipia sp.]|nr:S1 family peptidase [Afipia sp.]